jgi:hypothetical protein
MGRILIKKGAKIPFFGRTSLPVCGSFHPFHSVSIRVGPHYILHCTLWKQPQPKKRSNSSGKTVARTSQLLIMSAKFHLSHKTGKIVLRNLYDLGTHSITH